MALRDPARGSLRRVRLGSRAPPSRKRPDAMGRGTRRRRSSSSRSLRRSFSRRTPGRTGATAGSRPRAAGTPTSIRRRTSPRARLRRTSAPTGATGRRSTGRRSRCSPSRSPLVSGDSSDVAAWLFKALAAVAIVVAVVAVARVAARPALAAAFVGWNPVLAVHVAGGGHNDALVGGLAALAVALAVRRRNDLAGAAWVLAAFVKWIPLVFLALATLAARARGRRPVDGASPSRHSPWLPSRTWRYGLDWLRVLGPLADNAVLETSYALPSRLEQLGVPDGAAFAARARRGGRGLLVLARGALSRRASAWPRRVPRPRDDAVPRGLVPRLGGTAGRGGRGSRRPARGARAHGVPAPADDPALADRGAGRGSRPRRTRARRRRTPRSGRAPLRTPPARRRRSRWLGRVRSTAIHSASRSTGKLKIRRRSERWAPSVLVALTAASSGIEPEGALRDLGMVADDVLARGEVGAEGHVRPQRERAEEDRRDQRRDDDRAALRPPRPGEAASQASRAEHRSDHEPRDRARGVVEVDRGLGARVREEVEQRAPGAR